MTNLEVFDPSSSPAIADARVIDVVSLAVRRSSAELFPSEFAELKAILKNDFGHDKSTFPQVIHQCAVNIKKKNGITRVID